MLTLFKEDSEHSYSSGEESTWDFSCEDIVIEGVKKKYLRNMGKLVIEAAEGGDFNQNAILKINMMVMVSEDKDDLYKNIISDIA